MSMDEVYIEIESEIEIIKSYAKTQQTVILAKMLRTKQQFLKLNYITHLNNNWKIIFRRINLKLQACYYIQTNLMGAQIAYSPIFGPENFCLIKYTNHFFNRYKKRTKIQLTSIDKIIYNFFKSNFDIKIGNSTYESNGTRHTRIISHEGVGFGFTSPSKLLISLQTFLPHEDLTESQIEIMAFLKDNIDELKSIKDPYPLREIPNTYKF